MPLEIAIAGRLISGLPPEDQVAFCVGILCQLAEDNAEHKELVAKGFKITEGNECKTAADFIMVVTQPPPKPRAVEA